MSAQLCDIDSDCPPGLVCIGGRCVADPGPEPGPVLPGLGQLIRRRYTANGVISDEMSLSDFFHDVLFPTARIYIAQNDKGQLAFKNKKPVPFAFTTSSASVGAVSINVDNLQPWISSPSGLVLIAPHTNQSELATVNGASYSSSQNSVGLSSSGGIFSISGFSGCNGSTTPATASITVTGTGTPPVTCSITLDGTVIEFITSTGDTTQSIASYIAGVISTHPALFRRFTVVWTEGTSVVYLTARFGALSLVNGLIAGLPSPLASPTTAPTLSASGSGSSLVAGLYAVCYTAYNANGESLLSNYKTVTVTAGQQINVSSISLPSGATGLRWYMSPEGNSTYLRFFKDQSSPGGFAITAAPKLSAPLPPDLNRTGAEVMTISAAFSDRSFSRARLGSSNVMRGTFEWHLGDREDSINQIKLKYRDAAQDYRLVELRLRDDAHIAKTKKTSPMEVNGQFINNSDQAERIAAGLLTEKRTADYFESWTASRTALLLQEGDVVAITNNGSGVVNLPVIIEDIEFEVDTVSMPWAKFVGRLYASTIYDDSIVEHEIPIINEN